MKKFYSYSDYLLIVLFAVVPLFLSFPYRVNIFLTWEGAYRISEGQIPFRDFGTPLGGMFWAIPAMFMKLFGTQLITLIKAQVFINIISGLAFRSMLRSVGVEATLRFFCLFIFCASFSFFNFWPWYNHTVIVYQFVGLAFITGYILRSSWEGKWKYLVAAAFFMVCSFLTKQDGGAMGFLIGGALLVYNALVTRKWKPVFIYGGGFAALLALLVLVFGAGSFGYWFNHGQAPHSARVSAFELVTEFLGRSAWIKFYLFLVVLLALPLFQQWKSLWANKTEMVFLLLVVFILGEAAVFQVTSYTPPDNNIFFHSFAAAYILYRIGKMGNISFASVPIAITVFACIVLWWSSIFWKYTYRLAARFLAPDEATVSPGGENVVNRNTFMIRQEVPVTGPVAEPENTWTFCALPSFKKIYMPSSTVAGIDRLMKKYPAGSAKNLKVLNMSELTPLAKDMGFALERSPEYPLWFHLGVGMFNKQAIMFEERIGRKHYDLVLFEHIPSLNNFYPFRVRDSLKVHYQLVDSFAAPRRGDTPGNIEVYTPR